MLRHVIMKIKGLEEIHVAVLWVVVPHSVMW